MQKMKKNRKLWVAGICLGGAAVITGVLLLLRSPDGQEEPELPVSAAGASEMQDTTEQAESEPGEEFDDREEVTDGEETADRKEFAEAQLGYEHAELLTEWENVEGCKEQTILCKMNVEQYSPAEIEEASEAGRPIPGKYQTADMWYLCIGRENSPWAYVLAMKEEYCAREEAVMFSWWIEFRDDAWQ